MPETQRHVLYATGSRADYGIVRRYLKQLDGDPQIDLGVLATGTMLSDEYGYPIELVRRDGLRVEAEIPLPLDSQSNEGVIGSMAAALQGFGSYFERNKPDMLIVLGDRYEMFSVATAAAMQRVPILHIHGGEATFGNYDEFIRHAITKMALFHITSTEEYRRRVIQLGEHPSRVWNLGSLGAENCLLGDGDELPEEITSLPVRGYGVVLFHPETLTDADPTSQVREVLEAVDDSSELQWVFLGSNADTGSDGVRTLMRRYVQCHDGVCFFENLTPGAYHYLVKHSVCLVGNSSSGIIEAPTLGTRTVNIGHRQDGRVRGDSVIDVPCERESIIKGIDCCMEMLGKPIGNNPYYLPDSAVRYHKVTSYVLNLLDSGGCSPKEFYDL